MTATHLPLEAPGARLYWGWPAETAPLGTLYSAIEICIAAITVVFGIIVYMKKREMPVAMPVL
jgi:hypothetical protein